MNLYRVVILCRMPSRKAPGATAEFTAHRLVAGENPDEACAKGLEMASKSYVAVCVLRTLRIGILPCKS